MDGRTMKGMENLEKLQAMRTPRHQLRYPPKVRLVIP